MPDISNYLETKIEGKIEADEIHIGYGVVVEPGAVIKCQSVELGDFCFVGNHVKILAPSFEIGDYTKLHAFSFAHGEKPLKIGRNCWIGGGVVLDSNGGLTIEDGVGIGSGSQIWTHIQFGDLVQGCRFYSREAMTIRRDAWFVGHCLVSPVSVGERSMALLGSVVTREMLPNHVYAGVPAKDITDSFGPQFADVSREEKERRLRDMLDAFMRRHPEFKGWSPEFDVEYRTYRKTLCAAEVAFFRENVPLVKFVPEAECVGVQDP